MAAVNPTLIYRPLWAGISIMCPATGAPGTLGCFARDVANKAWFITARHVLAANVPLAGQTIATHQPDDMRQPSPISSSAEWRLDASSEVIAAPLAAGIHFYSAAIGLGAWTGLESPSNGQLVTKSGATTGVTLGRVENLRAGRFDVRHLVDLPDNYCTSSRGDSGAVWLDSTTRAILGIHIGQRANGTALAIRADIAFAELHVSVAL